MQDSFNIKFFFVLMIIELSIKDVYFYIAGISLKQFLIFNHYKYRIQLPKFP